MLHNESLSGGLAVAGPLYKYQLEISDQIINMLMTYQLIDPLKIEDHHNIVFMAVECFQRYFEFPQNIFCRHLIRNAAQNLMLFARE